MLFREQQKQASVGSFTSVHLETHSLLGEQAWWEELQDHGLIVKTGMAQMERYQTYGNHIVDSVPVIQFQPSQ